VVIRLKGNNIKQSTLLQRNLSFTMTCHFSGAVIQGIHFIEMQLRILAALSMTATGLFWPFAF
jgi:hypothetical protein